MKDTVNSLLESTLYPEMDNQTKNIMAFSQLDTLTESQIQLTGYTPDKVIVLVDESSNNYFIEFNHNLERLMHDQDINIEEAVDRVMAANDISKYSDMSIIVDESSLKKLDLNSISEAATFNFVKM